MSKNKKLTEQEKLEDAIKSSNIEEVIKIVDNNIELCTKDNLYLAFDKNNEPIALEIIKNNKSLCTQEFLFGAMVLGFKKIFCHIVEHNHELCTLPNFLSAIPQSNDLATAKIFETSGAVKDKITSAHLRLALSFECFNTAKMIRDYLETKEVQKNTKISTTSSQVTEEKSSVKIVNDSKKGVIKPDSKLDPKLSIPESNENLSSGDKILDLDVKLIQELELTSNIDANNDTKEVLGGSTTEEGE